MIPSHVIELNPLRSEKFLQRPSSSEPAAARQSIFRWGFWLEILEYNEAYFRIPVPLKHGIDRFGQLGTARFVDTASIDPRIVEAIFQGETANSSDLGVIFLDEQSGEDMSWKLTSSSPHVWERIPY